jgi:acetyl esterase/lipase
MTANELNRQPRSTLTIAQRRAQLSALSASHEPKPDGVIEEDLQIASRGKHHIPVRIYKGKFHQPGGALFIMIHGGGFTMGGLDTREEDCRRLVTQFGFVVVNVDYRLAPEHVWPAAVEDCWDAITWVCEVIYSYIRIRTASDGIQRR